MVDSSSIDELESKVRYLTDGLAEERSAANWDAGAWATAARTQSAQMLETIRVRVFAHLSRAELDVLAGSDQTR
jgi:hypothetical protein